MSAEKCIHLHRWSRPTPGQDRFEVKYLRYLRDTQKPEAILLSLTPLVFERFLPSLTLWLSPNCLTRYYFRISKQLSWLTNQKATFLTLSVCDLSFNMISTQTLTKNQLTIVGDNIESVISSSGEGWSRRVILGFTTGLFLTFCGAIFTLGLATASVGPLLNGLWHDSLLLLLFSPAPVCMGGGIALYYFRLGWNATTITITNDRLAIRYDGKLAGESYNVPMAEIKYLQVQARMGYPSLVMRLGCFRNDIRTILHNGTMKELHRVEHLIQSRLKDGGLTCE